MQQSLCRITDTELEHVSKILFGAFIDLCFTIKIDRRTKLINDLQFQELICHFVNLGGRGCPTTTILTTKMVIHSSKLALIISNIVKYWPCIVKYWPWKISVAGFWLSDMASFVKDGDATAPYSDMEAPHVGWYGGFLALRYRRYWYKPNHSCGEQRHKLMQNFQMNFQEGHREKSINIMTLRVYKKNLLLASSKRKYIWI